MTDILIIAGGLILVLIFAAPLWIWAERKERQDRRDWIAGKRR